MKNYLLQWPNKATGLQQRTCNFSTKEGPTNN